MAYFIMSDEGGMIPLEDGAQLPPGYSGPVYQGRWDGAEYQDLTPVDPSVVNDPASAYGKPGSLEYQLAQDGRMGNAGLSSPSAVASFLNKVNPNYDWQPAIQNAYANQVSQFNSGFNSGADDPAQTAIKIVQATGEPWAQQAVNSIKSSPEFAKSQAMGAQSQLYAEHQNDGSTFGIPNEAIGLAISLGLGPMGLDLGKLIGAGLEGSGLSDAAIKAIGQAGTSATGAAITGGDPIKAAASGGVAPGLQELGLSPDMAKAVSMGANFALSGGNINPGSLFNTGLSLAGSDLFKDLMGPSQTYSPSQADNEDAQMGADMQSLGNLFDAQPASDPFATQYPAEVATTPLQQQDVPTGTPIQDSAPQEQYTPYTGPTSGIYGYLDPMVQGIDTRLFGGSPGAGSSYTPGLRDGGLSAFFQSQQPLDTLPGDFAQDPDTTVPDITTPSESFYTPDPSWLGGYTQPEQPLSIGGGGWFSNDAGPQNKYLDDNGNWVSYTPDTQDMTGFTGNLDLPSWAMGPSTSPSAPFNDPALGGSGWFSPPPDGGYSFDDNGNRVYDNGGDTNFYTPDPTWSTGDNNDMSSYYDYITGDGGDYKTSTATQQDYIDAGLVFDNGQGDSMAMDGGGNSIWDENNVTYDQYTQDFLNEYSDLGNPGQTVFDETDQGMGEALKDPTLPPNLTGGASGFGDILNKLKALLAGGAANTIKNGMTQGRNGGAGGGGTGGYELPLAGILGSLMEYKSQSDYGKNISDAMKYAVDKADPFSSQRGMYQTELSKMFSDPNYFTNNPLLKGLNANAVNDTARAMAARGYNMSGNETNAIAQRLQGNNMDFAKDLMGKTMTAAGATFGTGQSGNIASDMGKLGAQTGLNQSGALGNLFGNVMNGQQPSPWQQVFNGAGNNQNLMQYLFS